MKYYNLLLFPLITFILSLPETESQETPEDPYCITPNTDPNIPDKCSQCKPSYFYSRELETCVFEHKCPLGEYWNRLTTNCEPCK